MSRIASLTIHESEFKFSAGHFTIFSETDREALHGHNYGVSIQFEMIIGDNGLSFDYRHYKKKFEAIRKKLNTHFLLPAHSPFLKLREEGDYTIATFAGKDIPFLKEDVVILPVTNVTIEELSHWLLGEITEDQKELATHGIHGLRVSVFNGPGQSASASWEVPVK